MELTVWSMLLTRPFLTPVVGMRALADDVQRAIVGDFADEHDDLARPDVERHQDRFDLQVLPFLDLLGPCRPGASAHHGTYIVGDAARLRRAALCRPAGLIRTW